MTCPMCFRQLVMVGKVFPNHEHTPLLGERCAASGKTPEQAKKAIKKSIADFKKKYAE